MTASRSDRAWLRSVTLRMNDVRRPRAVGMKLNLPPEYLLIHRVWLGGIGVLCQIGGIILSPEPHSPPICPASTSPRAPARAVGAPTPPGRLMAR